MKYFIKKIRTKKKRTKKINIKNTKLRQTNKIRKRGGTKYADGLTNLTPEQLKIVQKGYDKQMKMHQVLKQIQNLESNQDCVNDNENCMNGFLDIISKNIDVVNEDFMNKIIESKKEVITDFFNENSPNYQKYQTEFNNMWEKLNIQEQVLLLSGKEQKDFQNLNDLLEPENALKVLKQVTNGNNITDIISSNVRSQLNNKSLPKTTFIQNNKDQTETFKVGGIDPLTIALVIIVVIFTVYVIWLAVGAVYAAMTIDM